MDHSGVSNSTLIEEGTVLAQMYNNKSVAEQNSIDVAWNLLMEDKFSDFREAIYSTREEFQRFRQLLVNTILATDIMDKELKTLRNARWDKAFMSAPDAIKDPNNWEHKRGEATKKDQGKDEHDVFDAAATNRKATIVIEHLIQASDVAHTMQHWHVYLKWNERFFCETYKAFLEGRSATKNPIEGWYQGELGFFDFYIIPLAKKLKECGVFGVSSDEYLNYAMTNRSEWARKGQTIVQEYVSRYHAKDFRR